MEDIMYLPQAVSKNEWNTKEGTGKSIKNGLHAQQLNGEKNQTYNPSHC